MRTILISTFVAVGLLVASPAARAQAPQNPGEAGLAPIPGALDEMLAVALKSNPDILLADAKVREAQAALNAARLKVTQDVVKAFHDRSRFENAIVGVRGTFERMQKLVQTGQAPTDELEKAKTKVVDAEIDLRQWEAQVRYLLGLGGSMPGAAPAPSPAALEVSVVSARRPEMSEKMKEALKAPFTFALEGPQPLEDVLKSLVQISGLNIIKDKNLEEEYPIQFSLKDATLEGGFTAIADMTRDLCFVVRDYGLMITTRDRARGIYAPTIPPDVFLAPEVVPAK